jgi:hypothetical protein
MDAAHILVAVLTTAAVGWLVWVEFQCRRNRVKQTTGETAEEGTSQPAGNKFGTGDDERALGAGG